MVLLATLLVALGAGLVAYAVAATRAEVAAQPSAVAVALGQADLPEEETAQPPFLYRALEPVLVAGGRLIRRLSPGNRLELLRRRITWAGLDGRLTLERVLGYKAGGALLGLLLGLVGGPGSIPTLLWTVLLVFLFSFLPDLVLGSRADARQAQIGRELPEALDLLALTVEAGLGLEQALEVVVENGRGPLAEELTRVLREVELGVTRREALGALRERTAVPELSSFVVSLVQADQVGASVGEVLKGQASQVRLKRRQKAREEAAKTPVKILFPLIIGIFPALFIVILGPAIIGIAGSLF